MKLRYLLLATVILASCTVQSQTWKLIPNPDTTSEGFSFYSSQVLNGVLYTGYKNSSGKYQLAKFDGKKTTLIPNNDTGTIYNNGLGFGATASQLFFLYSDSNYYNSHFSIVKFDGKKVSHLTLPAYYHYTNNDWYGTSFFNFSNKLYTILQNDTDNSEYLGRYDSVMNTFIPISSPPNYFNSVDFRKGYYIYNNKMYLIQNDNTYIQQLYQFDGNNYSSTPLVDSSSNSIKYVNNFIGYNGNIYFSGQIFDTSTYTYTYHIYKYDGIKITKIPDNPDNTIDLISSVNNFVVYNNNLYFTYFNTIDNTNMLGWYDGISTHVLHNPENGVGVNIQNSSIYNNSLFCNYTKANGKTYMAKYNGIKLIVINNPDTLSKGVLGSFSLNNHLYFVYFGVGIDSSKFYYGRYNDTNLVIFKYPDNGEGANFGEFYNNALYIGYHTAKGNYQIAMIDSGLAATALNTIIGKTITPAGKTIKNSTINFKGDGAGSDNTDSTGIYSISLSNGNYTILPTKNNEVNKTNGVTAIDLAITQAHVLGKALLNSPYKLIAADVNGDGKVTALDLVYMKRLILGIDTTFTNTSTKETRLWAFVDSSYKFADSTNPFPFKDSIIYTNLNANKTNQTFIGIKLGDVNWDWNPALARSINNNKETPVPVSNSLFINRNNGILFNKQRRK